MFLGLSNTKLDGFMPVTGSRHPARICFIIKACLNGYILFGIVMRLFAQNIKATSFILLSVVSLSVFLFKLSIVLPKRKR